MFSPNIGSVDRAVRAVAGIALIAAAVLGDGMAWGWIGLIPLATAVVSFCPAYRLLGWRTCKLRQSTGSSR
ncbi:YgaP family membrane protein [Arhodomonas sp. AD133]|uniref:YgaP family membrane protein n=1 Tax=Arhodomonas sp. AD133 TaxID=3415009 RepID=UPI003EB77B4E